MKKKVTVLQNAKTYFEKKKGMYIKTELQTFIDELRILLSFMEGQIETAPETVTIKKQPKGPMV